MWSEKTGAIESPTNRTRVPFPIAIGLAGGGGGAAGEGGEGGEGAIERKSKGAGSAAGPENDSIGVDKGENAAAPGVEPSGGVAPSALRQAGENDKIPIRARKNARRKGSLSLSGRP